MPFRVLAEVKAAEVNPTDTYIIGGSHSVTPVFDMAGIVKTVGPGVEGFR